MTFSWEEILNLKIKEVHRINQECENLTASGVDCVDLLYRLKRFYTESSYNSNQEESEALDLCKEFDFSSESSLLSLKGKCISCHSLNRFLLTWCSVSLPSFSAAVFLQPQLEASVTQLSHTILWEFCATQWSARYISWKPWIIRILSKAADSFDLPTFKASLIASLLCRRFSKGKLDPLRESVALAQLLALEAPIEFIDKELSSLNELLEESKSKNDEDELNSTIRKLNELETSYGCHCD